MIKSEMIKRCDNCETHTDRRTQPFIIKDCAMEQGFQYSCVHMEMRDYSEEISSNDHS